MVVSGGWQGVKIDWLCVRGREIFKFREQGLVRVVSAGQSRFEWECN